MTNPIPNSAANRARVQHRCALRRYVTAAGTGEGCRARSRERAAEILRNRPMCIKNTLVWTVLDWIYGATDGEIRRLLRHAGVFNEYRTVSQLTDRQIDALGYALSSPSIATRSAA